VRSIVDQYLSRSDFKPKIALETENTVTTLAMAKADMGIVICPELFLRDIRVPAAQVEEKGLDLFPLHDHSANLVAGYRRDRYISHFAERFVAILQDVLQETHANQT
jgi:DNA-binding transcriptional LysR family regulator